MKLTVLLTAAVLGTTLPVLSQMNYQGRLTGSAGGVLADGQYVIEFSLWDAATGGSQIWGPYVTDGGSDNGRGPRADLVSSNFNVIIGNLDTEGRSLTQGLATASSRFLQIKVGTNAAITPRQLILASPRALSADVIPNVTPNGTGNGVTIAGATTITGATTTTNMELIAVGATPYIDFASQAGVDNNARIIYDGPSNQLSFQLAAPGIYTFPSGNVAINTPSTACTFQVTGNNSSGGTACFAPPSGGQVSHIHYGADQDWYIRSGKASGRVIIQDSGGTASIGNLAIYPGSHFGIARPDAVTLDVPGTTGTIDIWDNLEVKANCYVHADIWREYNGAWYKLGNLFGHNYGTYWESSDQRLKKEIAPLTGALDTLGQIRGVSYFWNETGLQHLTRGIEETWASKSRTEADNKKLWAEKRAEAAKELSRRQTGFIAQELEKVFPSWVRTDEKGFKQIDIHSMAAVLVQGVNELNAQNKQQAAAFTELEKANAALKTRVAELEAAAKAGETRLAKLETTTANLAALLEKKSGAATTAGVSTPPAKR